MVPDKSADRAVFIEANPNEIIPFLREIPAPSPRCFARYNPSLKPYLRPDARLDMLHPERVAAVVARLG